MPRRDKHQSITEVQAGGGRAAVGFRSERSVPSERTGMFAMKIFEGRRDPHVHSACDERHFVQVTVPGSGRARAYVHALPP